ncbi:MAG: SLC13 family permease [Planctomycetaceae bacterium]
MEWTVATFVSLGVFLGTYVLISLQRIRFANLDRPSAALLGALLMVVLGVLPLTRAYAAVSYDTIFLLLGMMVVISYLQLAGFFEWMAVWILRHAGSPQRLLWLLVFASGGLSALFVNDTICLLFTPVMLSAVLRAGLPPTPYLIALATSSNIGSVMTLTGNPQNMLVGIFSGISYGRFFLILAPVAVVGLVVNAWLIERIYRGRLGDAFSMVREAPPAVDRTLLRRLFLVLALVLAGFLLPLHRWLPGVTVGQNLPLAAMAGAVLAVLVGGHPPRAALQRVDWPLLLFFGCLFVVVEAVRATGLLPALHEAIAPLFGTTAQGQAAVLAGFSVVMSNVVSNVPYVLVARGWVEGLGNPDLMWAVLAMASTFAGNLTIVGSVANMIVFEQARDRAPVGFREHFRVGLPLTLITTALGLALLLGMHALGWI